MGVILGWRCPVCGASGAVPCARCHASMRPAPPLPRFTGVDTAAALLSYRGTARELVARIKYRNQRAALRWLAVGMAELAPVADVVTWAPANAAHIRERGFDHGQLLAREVGRLLRGPVVGLLRRGADAPLTGRAAAMRVVELEARATTGTVLLVDDVITTGATCTAAAIALRNAGATGVSVLAAAYTPPPGINV